MKLVGPSEVHLNKYFAFLIDMAQNNECEENTSCDQFMKKYFPITQGNAYGAIPIVGAITSCFAAGITMQFLCDTMRNMIWAGGWFCVGFLMFVTVQIFWGFQAEKQKFLVLWMACKGFETLVAILCIVGSFVGGPWMMGLLAPSVTVLLVLIILLHVAYKKYQNLKKSEHNIFANQSLDNIVTK